MQITEVRVFPAKKADEKLKAFATVTFDHCFVVRDLKVINGNKGLFIAMPSRKRADGTYVDVAHPLDTKTRHYIEQAVLSEYGRTTAGEGSAEYAGMTENLAEQAAGQRAEEAV
jgi:stage V sporulation protein G